MQTIALILLLITSSLRLSAQTFTFCDLGFLADSPVVSDGVTDYTNNLLAWWKLDEGTGSTAVDAIGGHNITLSGSPAWLTNGIAFNGSTQFGSAANPSDFPMTNIWSIAFWGKKFSLNARWALSWGQNNSTSQWGILYNSGWRAETTTATFQTVSPTNVWAHIVFTYDATTLTIYTNGTIARSDALTAPNIVPNLFYIGQRYSANFIFDGNLGDIRFYTNVLSATQANQIYTNTLVNYP